MQHVHFYLHIDVLILNAALPLTTYPGPSTAAVTVVGLCLTVKPRRGSPHKADSCIHKPWFPLAWTVYFRLPSNPYLLSDFTVENKGMGNRFLQRSAREGRRAQERQKTWSDARQTFVSYTLCGEAE